MVESIGLGCLIEAYTAVIAELLPGVPEGERFEAVGLMLARDAASAWWTVES